MSARLDGEVRPARRDRGEDPAHPPNLRRRSSPASTRARSRSSSRTPSSSSPRPPGSSTSRRRPSSSSTSATTRSTTATTPSIFTENQTAQDLSKAGDKLKKSVYEYVVTDSKVERSFVEKLDVSDEVVVYSKLPRGFFIPTPVGDYNPDWAIAFRTKGTVKHIYFVAETKGSLSEMELRPVEKAKIDCAKKFFAKLGTEQVTYDAVKSYDDLMTKVLA